MPKSKSQIKREKVQIVERTFSPVPVQAEEGVITLSFPDALREVMNGNKITRIEWSDNNTYGVLMDTFLMIYIKGEFHRWSVNDGDLFATDWIVLPKSN